MSQLKPQNDGSLAKVQSVSVDTNHDHISNVPEPSFTGSSSSSQISANDGKSDHFNHKDMDIEIWSKRDYNVWDTWTEKIIFCWSMFNIGITCYAVGGAGGILPWYYTIKFPLMVIARYFQYKEKSWHWFLLDFCYWANLLLLVYLWAFPSNKQLFTMIFALSNGPLLAGVPAFGNALVLHSLDKTTSLLIHLTPPIITYVIRWERHTDGFKYWDINNQWNDSVCDNGLSLIDQDNNCAHLRNFLLYPFLFVFGQQIVYFLLMQVIFRSTIENDPNALTTYRYLFRRRKGAVYRLISCLGPEMRVFVWGFVKFFNLFVIVSVLLTCISVCVCLM